MNLNAYGFVEGRDGEQKNLAWQCRGQLSFPRGLLLFYVELGSVHNDGPCSHGRGLFGPPKPKAHEPFWLPFGWSIRPSDFPVFYVGGCFIVAFCKPVEVRPATDLQSPRFPFHAFPLFGSSFRAPGTVFHIFIHSAPSRRCCNFCDWTMESS